ELLRPHLDRTLLSLLFSQEKQEALLDQTIYTQPALFSLEYALFQLWSSWGLQPNFVMGHSLGEYAAACAAGIFGLGEGLQLVAQRARLMQDQPAGGEMVAVAAGEEQVRAAIAPYVRTVSIAAINGPRNVVISGAKFDLESIVSRFAANGVQTRKLNVSHAFHSPLMEPMLAAFEKVVAGVRLHAPAIRFVSNLTGCVAKPEEVTQAAYWRNHLREPVRFAAGMGTLVESGCEFFLELGPSPMLLAMGRQCTAKSGTFWLPTLRPGRDDWWESLTSLQALHHAGIPVNWKGFDRDYSRKRIRLPTYPFQRERFWLEQRPGTSAGLPEKDPLQRPGVHPLLGVPLRSPALKDSVFESQLSAQCPVFLADHRICGRVIFPAAAYVEMALAGARRLFGEAACIAENVQLQEMLELQLSTRTSMQIVFRTQDRGSADFEIFSAPGNPQEGGSVWSRNVSGRVSSPREPEPVETKLFDLQSVRDRCAHFADLTALYQELRERGSEFGPAFRNLQALRLGTGETLAQISLAGGFDPYRLHPVLLDACFLAASQALPAELPIAEDEILLPVKIARIQVSRQLPAKFWSHAQLRGAADGRLFTLDLSAYDPEGDTLVRIAGLQLKLVKRRTLEITHQSAESEWLFQIQWQEIKQTEKVAPRNHNLLNEPGKWLILADEGGIGDCLRARLASSGQRSILARPGLRFARRGDGEFALDPENPADFERLLSEAGVTSQIPFRGVLHLWSLDIPVSDAMSAEDLARAQLLGCGSTLHLVQALAAFKDSSAACLWLVTRGAQATPDESAAVNPAMASLCGLGQVIASEHPQLHCRRIDLGLQEAEEAGDILFRELASGEPGEETIAFRAKSRFAPRLLRLSSTTATGAHPRQMGNPVQLNGSQAGVLENLCWTPMERVTPAPGEVEIQVQATGLNFRDVLSALGMYAGRNDGLGAECAGVIVRVGDGVEDLKPGDRVMAVAAGGFNTYVTLRAGYVAIVPDGLSILEAASIPVAFLTAWFGLHHLAQIEVGDRVLIHAATGGVGLAAVQLAQRAGAEIFATAGNHEKRSHLRKLGVTHLFDSRSLGFADEIMRETGGRGMDIVLNSLAGEFIPRSMSVLAPGGRFLELGKRDILTREEFAKARPDCEYNAYDLGEEASRDSSLLPALFKDLFAAFKSGELQPIPITAFSDDHVVDAFRFMAQAKHIGKIVVTKPEPCAAAQVSPPKLRLRDDATYLITGGLGGLGLETARWLAREGARSIALVGRHGPGAKAKDLITELIRGGTQVAIETCDVSDQEALAASLHRLARSMPPLRGIIHAAGVLDDGILEQQTWSRFERVMAPKVIGAWNLHRLTLSLELDFFVFFSAAATLIGSPGQGNYAAANAFMDGLAYHRKAKGLPALSINWGAWADTGMAARLGEQDAKRLIDRGVQPIPLSEGMSKLGELLFSSHVQIVAARIDWSKTFGKTGIARPPSLFLELLKPLTPRTGVQAVPQKGDAGEFIRRLSGEPPVRRFAKLKAHVESIAASALGLTGGRTLDSERPLHELGLDSLMSVELRNALATSLGCSLPPTLLFDFPTVESLTHFIAKNVLNLELTTQVSSDTRVASENEELAKLQGMSESEAELLLLSELDRLKR
ncbi:MAG: SDR family NAD(P)-dependent oxidoreductase, partial [Verrucomicrobia bacterium]|nr:SDR family NAD(P)-dependent oxidoreductase [Verrucomicrobiota bacterium]